MTASIIFDEEHYRLLNESREARVRAVLKDAIKTEGLHTAIDVGCGAGYFCGVLSSLGLNVTGIDGRKQNIEQSRRRVPQAQYSVANAEDKALPDLGEFDLVFCFGLLYHLENPFRAIRNLRAMTKKLLLVESVIYPGTEPTMGLVDEGFTDDQGLNHIAFYPTEACLAKMIYRSGFPHVSRFNPLPDHPFYRSSGSGRQVRTMLAASLTDLKSDLLKPIEEASSPIAPWDPSSGAPAPNLIEKVRRFSAKSFPEKLKTVRTIVKHR